MLPHTADQLERGLAGITGNTELANDRRSQVSYPEHRDTTLFFLPDDRLSVSSDLR